MLCFNPFSGEWTNPKASGSLPAPRSGHATIIMEGKVCANLCQGWVVRDPLQNLITCLFYHLGPLQKLSLQSIHNF